MIYANARADESRRQLIEAFQDFDAIFTHDLMKQLSIEKKDPGFKTLRYSCDNLKANWYLTFSEDLFQSTK